MAVELGVDLPWEDDLSILAKPLNDRIRNRLVAQPIEGFDSQDDGSPSKRSVNRYCDLARGGFGTLWVESITVNSAGRSNPRQLWLKESNLDHFSDMVKKIRAESVDPIFLVAQLTHSGRYSYDLDHTGRECAFLNPLIPRENERIISDDEVNQLIKDYLKSVDLAAKAGFDAVDIRACHGYLINEFFAAYERKGLYGGSYDNRVRLLLKIVEGALNLNSIEVSVRLNMFDGLDYPFGWGVDPASNAIDLTEPLRLVKDLYSRGVKLLNITNGIGAVTPFLIRPYDSGGPKPAEAPLKGIERMLMSARAAKQVAPNASVVVSGLSWLRNFGPQVAAGGIQKGWFDLAGWGRQTLAWPNFARAVLHGPPIDRRGCCTTCSGCSNLIKKEASEVKCVFRERLKVFQI